MTTQSTRKAIETHILAKLDERVQKLIPIAIADLWHGPLSAENVAEEQPDLGFEYPSFQEACDEIKSALRLARVSELYVDDLSGEIVESEPDCCAGEDCEECKGVPGRDASCGRSLPEDWTRYEKQDIIKIVLGKELAPYCR